MSNNYIVYLYIFLHTPLSCKITN